MYVIYYYGDDITGISNVDGRLYAQYTTCLVCGDVIIMLYIKNVHDSSVPSLYVHVHV